MKGLKNAPLEKELKVKENPQEKLSLGEEPGKKPLMNKTHPPLTALTTANPYVYQSRLSTMTIL